MTNCNVSDSDIVTNNPVELCSVIEFESSIGVCIHGTHLSLKSKFRDHFNQLFTHSNPSMTPNRVLEINEVALQYPNTRCIGRLFNVLNGKWWKWAASHCRPAVRHQWCKRWYILEDIVNEMKNSRKEWLTVIIPWSISSSFSIFSATALPRQVLRGISLSFSVGHRYRRVRRKEARSTKRKDYNMIE